MNNVVIWVRYDRLHPLVVKRLDGRVEGFLQWHRWACQLFAVTLSGARRAAARREIYKMVAIVGNGLKFRVLIQH